MTIKSMYKTKRVYTEKMDEFTILSYTISSGCPILSWTKDQKRN